MDSTSCLWFRLYFIVNLSDLFHGCLKEAEMKQYTLCIVSLQDSIDIIDTYDNIDVSWLVILADY